MELGGGHVVGVPAELGKTPGGVRRIRLRLATSATAPISYARSRARNSSIVRVEWPIVHRVISIEHSGCLRQRFSTSAGRSHWRLTSGPFMMAATPARVGGEEPGRSRDSEGRGHVHCERLA